MSSHFTFAQQNQPRMRRLCSLTVHGTGLLHNCSFELGLRYEMEHVLSAGMFCCSNYLWASHFLSHYHQVTHVLCFFLFNVWCESEPPTHPQRGWHWQLHSSLHGVHRLVPFGFFISLSVNETSLPNQQAAMADEVYREGGRTTQKSGLISAFSFVREKRDDMMPSLAKKV